MTNLPDRLRRAAPHPTGPTDTGFHLYYEAADKIDLLLGVIQDALTAIDRHPEQHPMTASEAVFRNITADLEPKEK